MGTTPNPRDVDALIARSATETDFQVREVLTWSLTRELLTDPDGEVARSARRAATVLVPKDEKHDLTAVLITQLARGPRDTQLA